MKKLQVLTYIVSAMLCVIGTLLMKKSDMMNPSAMTGEAFAGLIVLLVSPFLTGFTLGVTNTRLKWVHPLFIGVLSILLLLTVFQTGNIYFFIVPAVSSALGVVLGFVIHRSIDLRRG